MSGHSAHHHHPPPQPPPVQTSYYPSSSAPLHPVHLYHSNHPNHSNPPPHRASLAGPPPPPGVNGHSSPATHSSTPISASSGGHRHSMQMSPHSASAQPSSHHPHPSQQQSSTHHLPPSAQPHSLPPTTGGHPGSGPVYANHHHHSAQQPPPPPQVPSPHHSQSHLNHPGHPRDSPTVRDYHSHHTSPPHHHLSGHPQRPGGDLPPQRERDQPRDPHSRSHAAISSHSSDRQQGSSEPPPPPPPGLRDHQSRDSVHLTQPASHLPHPSTAPLGHPGAHHLPSPAPPHSAHHSPHHLPRQGSVHLSSSVPAPAHPSQPLSSHGPPPTGPVNGTRGGTTGAGSHIPASQTGPPHAPPTLPAHATGGGGPTGRQLAQPPAPTGGGNVTQASEEDMVASILRDGEIGLEAQLKNSHSHSNPAVERLVKETELTWIAAGSASEALGNYKRAVECYEKALKHNPLSASALTKAAGIHRHQERFKQAAQYFSRLLKIHDDSGHCYLMVDQLPKAYTSYQQALHLFQTPKSEPKLWYGIGILYDRYGSLEHAEEAFSSVIKMDPNFEKANEIYFRLGIIYKQQRKGDLSLECFQWILDKPPSPLTEIDIWFQVGHVHEQQGNFVKAKEAYERVLAENPTHAKVLQQLGGLYCREGSSFYDPQAAVHILSRSLQADNTDAVSWYLLGRAYMTLEDYNKAYESYQQAVYREGKNPAFWCSIGVLYYAITQYHDSLDAYSRAIRINPFLSEVWFNLGALYESCKDQMTDAVDAYQRAAQLDANNTHITARLAQIKLHKETGAPLSAPPSPKDMSHTSVNWPFPSGLNGPSEGSFGPSGTYQVNHEADPSRPTQSPPSPVANSHTSSARAISPVGQAPYDRPPGPVRPSTASSVAGVRPSSAGPFAHQPPLPSTLAHASHYHPSTYNTAQPPTQYPAPSSETNRRSSGGARGQLAPMEIEPSPRQGPRGASHAQYNLPHIRSVVESHSRGSSPVPPTSEMRRPLGVRDMASPKASPLIRSHNQVLGEASSSIQSADSAPAPVHPTANSISGYPRYPPSARHMDEGMPVDSRSAGLPPPDTTSQDADRDTIMREPLRFRPHSPDLRGPSTMYPAHRTGGDHGAGSGGYSSTSPYHPHHTPSHGLQHQPTNVHVPNQQTNSRYSPEQPAAHSPPYQPPELRFAASQHTVASMPSEDRRPSSRADYPRPSYQVSNYASSQPPSTRRYDPRYDETVQPSPQAHGSLATERASPQRPPSAVSRAANEEADRHKSLAAARQAQPSPTPSVAASEFSAAGGTNGGSARRPAKAKLTNSTKEDDLSPATHVRRRKPNAVRAANSSLAAVPNASTPSGGGPAAASGAAGANYSPSATGPATAEPTLPSLKEKRDRKKANTKVRGSLKAKIGDHAKGPSPSPAPPTLPSDSVAPGRIIPPTPSPPAVTASGMPDRKVDERFEEYDEVADVLLSLGGPPLPRNLPSQPSPTSASTRSAPQSAGSKLPLSGGSNKNGARHTGNHNGISPKSDQVSLSGGGSGSGRSPSTSSHSQMQQASPNQVTSSPEATMASGPVGYLLQPHQTNGPEGPTTETKLPGINSAPPPSTGHHSTGGPLSPYASFTKRIRGEGSSPSSGETGPDAKRYRSSIGHGNGSGQPSPRSQTNVARSPPGGANLGGPGYTCKKSPRTNEHKINEKNILQSQEPAITSGQLSPTSKESDRHSCGPMDVEGKMCVGGEHGDEDDDDDDEGGERGEGEIDKADDEEEEEEGQQQGRDEMDDGREDEEGEEYEEMR